MAATQEFTLIPVHARANLLGWASLALFGLTYRNYPMLKQGLIARLHFALAASAALLMPYAIYRVLHSDGLAMIASFAWLGAVLLFLVQLVRLVRASAD